MLKAYVFRLYPNDRQRKIINQTIGNSRFIYNYFLDDKIKEALVYREKYPETSLQELSEIITMETGKKITKSGLNHRFRKIKEIALRLESKD